MDLSYADKTRLVMAAVSAAGMTNAYIAELYDDHAIVEIYPGDGGTGASTCWSYPYTIDENGQAATLGERTKVVREVNYRAIKRVAPDTIEGLAIPYSKDIDGEHFDAETDLCLEWFGKSGRPALYDHGLSRGPGASKMGQQIEYDERPEGIWAQVQLERAHRYRKAVDQLIEEGALGFSSGAMQHLARVDRKSGRIERWPWVELSMTPIPANPDGFITYTVKSAQFLEHLTDDATKFTLAAVKAIAAGLGSEVGAEPDTATLDARAGRVSAAVDELRDHARAAAAMRVKAGRALSAANRERISKALATREAVLAAYADLETLLAETDPEAATKATDLLAREMLAFEATTARLLGVTTN